MMGYLVLSSTLSLLHRVVQKEIDQNSVNLRIWVNSQNLSSDQLHAPDATSSHLNLPCMSTFNLLLLPYRMIQQRTIPQAPQGVQNLWNTIIRKHSDLINIVELAKSFAFKGSPEISHANLGSLEESHALPVLETNDVVEAREAFGKEIHETGGRVVGFFDAIGETALVFLGFMLAPGI